MWTVCLECAVAPAEDTGELWLLPGQGELWAAPGQAVMAAWCSPKISYVEMQIPLLQNVFGYRVFKEVIKAK